MAETILIKNGLDIQLAGEAGKTLTEYKPALFAIKPTDFQGVFPRLIVKEGDLVKAGSPLFYNKFNDRIQFTSPVSGTVKEVRRGEKRVLLEVIIESDGKFESESFSPGDPLKLSREEIVQNLLKSGAWAGIRQRPYTIVADPGIKPKAVFVSAFDTHPLAPDYDFILKGSEKAFQTGLDALSRLTDGKVHLSVHAAKTTSEAFLKAKNVSLHYFSGPHPSGNIGTQIAHIDPINKGEYVFVLRPQEVVTIGRLFLEGVYNPERILALTGSEVSNPVYVKTLQGANIGDLIRKNVTNKAVRIISGNVLTGNTLDQNGFAGFYEAQITVIPEGKYHEFLGWVTPGLNKLSVSRTFFSWLMPGKKYQLDTNMHGGHRAHVMTGVFENYFGWNILPMQLIKACQTEDIDMMENLGIYEVDEEDFALCEFVDTSKTEIQTIIRNGINLIQKEMS